MGPTASVWRVPRQGPAGACRSSRTSLGMACNNLGTTMAQAGGNRASSAPSSKPGMFPLHRHRTRQLSGLSKLFFQWFLRPSLETIFP